MRDSTLQTRPTTRRALLGVWLTLLAVATAAGILLVIPGFAAVAVMLLAGCSLGWAWHGLIQRNNAPASHIDELDPLTGLYSRCEILNQLTKKLQQADEGTPSAIALMFLDFDRFKLINDSMGHDAGDKLLKQISSRIRKTLAPNYTPNGMQRHIGRLGGDEFVIILEGFDSDLAIAQDAQRLHDALTTTYDINGRTVHSSVSIGITTTVQGYTRAEEMLRDADTAMYEAKKAGRACSAWFDPAMHEAVRDAVELENDLRHAIERDELFLTYQPIISLEDATVTGFESLIRWRHPERGLVRPDQFIAIAEESLLIQPIGRWVIRTALEQAKLWRQRFPELTHMVMNVNLSRVQFADPGLTEFICQTLDELGLPHEALCLEITESTIMQDSDEALQLLRRFRELGIKLAMDDFGTGYSSLSHLHEFPLDSLKIDKAFIDNLSDNRDYAAVIQAITALAVNLGFSVVAEGLETIDQVAELQALACHKGQGYFFHKPAEPEVIEAYLSEREQREREGAATA